MTDKNSVSIIIPTYNRVAFLRRALHSIENQSHPSGEIIVVDDGSTDKTGTLVKTEFPGVKYIYQQNLGVSAARNAGILNSKGHWLAFLDSDDEWFPTKLGKQLGLIAKDSSIRVCHTEEIWIRNGTRVNPMKKHAKSGGWIFDHCLAMCMISPSSVIIHRSVFEKAGLFDETLPACEDYDLWLRITSLYPVSFINEPLIIKYGGHDDQLSRKYWGMDRFRIKALKKILNQGELSLEDENAARKILVKKARIYLNGARKRNRLDEVEYYQSLCRMYAD